MTEQNETPETTETTETTETSADGTATAVDGIAGAVDETSSPQTSSPEVEVAPAEAVLDEDLFMADDETPDEVIVEDAPLSADARALRDAQAKVAALEAQVAELTRSLAVADAASRDAQDKLLRKAADYENLRRRQQKEKEDLQKFAGESILRDMTPVLDDLDRAVEHLGLSASPEAQALVTGVGMVQRKFLSTLNKHGVVQLHSLGKPFDPQFHEAIQQVHNPDVPNNSVAQEFQRAYLLNERLLRPALVVVATGGPAFAAPAPEGSGDSAATLENSVESGQTE